MLKIRFENVHDDDTKTDAILGPFEWVQLTYNHLRVAPDGEHVAQINAQGYWTISPDWRTSGEANRFTDVIVFEES